MRRPGAAGAAALLLLACRAPAPGVAVERAYGFAPLTRDEGVAYLTLRAHGAADTLLAVATADAASAAVFAGGHGPGHMTATGPLPLPADSALTFAPGGLHLMVQDFVRLPQPGDTLHLTLTFARAGAVEVAVPLRAYAEGPPE